MEIEKLQIKMITTGTSLRTASSPFVYQQKVLPSLSIVQSVKGSYSIKLGNGSIHNTDSGGFFIAPANVLQTIEHHIDQESKIMNNRWLFIDMVINGKYRPDFIYDFPTIIPKENQAEMNSLFDELFMCKNIFDRYSICYQIMKLLIAMGSPKKSSYNKDLENVISYIIQNYNSNISVETLSIIAHMSQSNFYAVFKKQFAISPISYINNYRITMAAEKLLQTTNTIGDISKSVGFSDQLYFSKLFRKMYGISPREYRQQN